MLSAFFFLLLSILLDGGFQSEVKRSGTEEDRKKKLCLFILFYCSFFPFSMGRRRIQPSPEIRQRRTAKEVFQPGIER